MSLQPDGRIILAGVGETCPSGFCIYVGRYTTDGFLDTTFSCDGFTTTNTDVAQIVDIRSVVATADGRIVAGGYSFYGPANARDSDFLIARYLSGAAVTPTPTPTPTPAGTVQFTSGSYEVSEGAGGGASSDFGVGEMTEWRGVRATALVAAAGSASLTVTRTDATQAAAVDYATADGTAGARSDYTAAFGTLRFAPGETSKAIVVHVTDDRFQESAETFSVVLSDPVGVSLGSPSAAAVQVTSDDAATGPNPVADPSFDPDFFVRQHYADFLGREADASGLAFWKDELTQCEARPEAGRQPRREVKRVNVSAAFITSVEYRQRFGREGGRAVDGSQ